MIKKELRFVQLLFFFFLLPFGKAGMGLFSQTTTNSPYSIYGLGDLETKAFAPCAAMGDVKYAVAMPYSVNIANPASYGFLVFPTFEAGFTSNFLSLSYNGTTKKANSTYFKNMTFAFPVSKRWWASSFGIVPYSKMGYSISDADTVNNFGIVNYTYKGSGGISRFFIGNTFNLLKDSAQQFSIGANISYLFGSLTKTRRVMPEAATQAYNTIIQNSTTVGDFHYEAGAIYSRKFGRKLNISLGGDYEFAKKLKATNIVFAESYTLTGTTAVAKDTIQLDTIKDVIFVPQKISGGISVYYNSQWLIAADYSTQNWKEFSYFGQNIGLAKQEQISFGIQYNYNAKESRNLFENMSYRGGFRYANTQLYIKGQQLKQYGISFGIGVPIGVKSKSTFNLAVETGVRGENKNRLVGEQFTNITFGFSFTPSYYDRWFVKPKID